MHVEVEDNVRTSFTLVLQTIKLRRHQSQSGNSVKKKSSLSGIEKCLPNLHLVKAISNLAIRSQVTSL